MRLFAVVLASVCLSGCFSPFHHTHTVAQEDVDTTPVSAPVDIPPALPDATNTIPSQPVVQSVAQSNGIGLLQPSAQLSAEDSVTINSVIPQHDLDSRRNRCVLAGDNFPDTPARLDYCVFDTACRDLLLLTKTFKVNPVDIRLVRDKDCVKANLKKHIDWAFDDIHPGDERSVFLSMHGSADTLSDGTINGLICTYDMISTNIWDETTELTIDYWIEKCKSVPPGCNVSLVFDLCHAGADIRALFGVESNVKKVRSAPQPDYVTKRVDAATKRRTMRDVNQYNVQFFPMCLDSELSSEGPSHGGSGSWALASSFDKNGPDAPCTTIARDGNAFLRSDGDTQHMVVLGKNIKAPFMKAIGN